MFCTKCGKELKDGSEFCVYCGAPVKKEEEEAQETPALSADVHLDQGEDTDKRENSPNAKKHKVLPVIGMAFAILLIAAVAFGIVYFLDHRESLNRHEKTSVRMESEDSAGENADHEIAESETEEPEEIQEGMEETAKPAEDEAEGQGPKQPGTVVLGAGTAMDENMELAEPETDYVGENENSEDEDYLLPGSDSKYITMADLKGFSAEECRIARNEIYARHGRKFQDEELQAYFDSKDWYHGTIDPDSFKEDMLNDYELANRDLIVEFEKKSGYR